jgi:hypothetical protein
MKKPNVLIKNNLDNVIKVNTDSITFIAHILREYNHTFKKEEINNFNALVKHFSNLNSLFFDIKKKF